MVRHILVVCVGNICRSPMAEALLRHELGEDDDYSVESAGLAALVGHPASEQSVDLMQAMGLDISDHRARQVHPDMVRAADLVLVMESAHKRSIDAADPTARGKVFRLGEWQDKDIIDPYGEPRAAYAVALKHIEAGVSSWLGKLKED
jgi:protein-tyrosine phosphatase